MTPEQVTLYGALARLIEGLPAISLVFFALLGAFRGWYYLPREVKRLEDDKAELKKERDEFAALVKDMAGHAGKAIAVTEKVVSQ